MGIGKGGVSGASLFPKSERASLCPQRKPIEAPKTKVVMMMAAKSGFPRERKRAPGGAFTGPSDVCKDIASKPSSTTGGAEDVNTVLNRSTALVSKNPPQC